MLQKVKSFFCQIGKHQIWNKQFAKYAPKTRVCRLCFDVIKQATLHNLVQSDICVCPKCQEQFNAVFEKTKIDGVMTRAVYDYNEFMQSALYKLKGCGDIEIAPCFLNYHLPWLQISYRGHIIIPVPSHIKRDDERGFNQVEEIFRYLRLPILKALIKTENRKQSDLSHDERKKIGDIIAWDDTFEITGKKILLVDDVMTTGSTLRACIKLIKAHFPKSLKVLVISRVADKGQR